MISGRRKKLTTRYPIFIPLLCGQALQDENCYARGRKFFYQSISLLDIDNPSETSFTEIIFVNSYLLPQFFLWRPNGQTLFGALIRKIENEKFVETKISN